MSPERIPANPAYALAYGIGFTLASAAAFVVFSDYVADVTAGEVTGRAGPAILSAPFLWAAVAVVAYIRALLAVGPWNAYRNSTTVEQRRSRVAGNLKGEAPVTALIVPGIIVTLGAAVLLVAAVISALSDPDRPSGPLLLLQWVVLAAILAGTLLGAAIHIIHFRKFRAPTNQAPVSNRAPE